MVKKGKISTLSADGRTATVTPYSGGVVSAPLVVQFFLIGALPIGTPVIYSVFEDNTGIILARADGEWNHKLQEIGGEQ